MVLMLQFINRPYPYAPDCDILSHTKSLNVHPSKEDIELSSYI